MAVVVLSGGGTAGHINPALALAEVLEDRGCKVYFAGTPSGVEARLVPQAGLSFKGFDASGFRRKHPLSIISGSAKILNSARKAKKWFSEIQPDVVVGFGGYVSIPVSMAAEDRHIPVVVHEQNSVMGMANKYLAKRAQAICLTYAGTVDGGHEKAEVIVTGNPVRKSVLSVTREEGRKYLGIPEDARMLLVFGGSGGARHINQAIASVREQLMEREDLYIVHITGPREYEASKAELNLSEKDAERYLLMDYQDHMAETLAAADAIVSRAGATSLAEISARRIPALLVPFPFAAEDHQTTNAKEYVEAGAAFLLPDDKISGPAFLEKVSALVDDADLRKHMVQAAGSFGTADAASNLADVVLAQIGYASEV